MRPSIFLMGVPGRRATPRSEPNHRYFVFRAMSTPIYTCDVVTPPPNSPHPSDLEKHIALSLPCPILRRPSFHSKAKLLYTIFEGRSSAGKDQSMMLSQMVLCAVKLYVYAPDHFIYQFPITGQSSFRQGWSIN